MLKVEGEENAKIYSGTTKKEFIIQKVEQFKTCQNQANAKEVVVNKTLNEQIADGKKYLWKNLFCLSPIRRTRNIRNIPPLAKSDF